MDIPTTPINAPADAKPVPYIPGYVVAKMLIAAFGLVLIGLSMIKLGPVLVHLLTGERAQAEAVRVVRVSAGGQEEVLTSNRAIEAYTKDEKLRKDRGYVYWNEFRYTTREGAEVEFRWTGCRPRCRSGTRRRTCSIRRCTRSGSPGSCPDRCWSLAP